MFKYQTRTFEEAKEYALRHHDTVIRMSETVVNKNSGENKKFNSVTSINQLRSALAGNGNANAPITVDPVVLSTLLNNNNFKKRKEGDTSGAKASDRVDGSNKKMKKDNIDFERKVCFSFRDKGKCDFGSNCYFAHSK